MLDFSVYSRGQKMKKNYTDSIDFTMFYSASTTQLFLKDCYRRIGVMDAEQKSFENCYRFIYFLEHGQLYLKQAEVAPLALQPTLLFYGLANLIKACILTDNPNYPEKTTMLAHGVSTRRRKKQQYQFFQDEIKCQKNGLFPIMSEKMFGKRNLEGAKINMELLLRQIPELSGLFKSLCGTGTFLKAQEISENKYNLDKLLLDHFHMTENRFMHFLQSKCQTTITVDSAFSNQNKRNITIHFQSFSINHSLPFKYNIFEKSLFFPKENNELITYPELMVHYLLLYNLSIIARYETEWWSELIKMTPNHDFPFIHAFLKLSVHKSPFLIFDYLFSKHTRKLDET